MGEGLSRQERRERILKIILVAALLPLASLALYELWIWSLTYSGF
ncbi:MAG TPA: hypothetical protein VF808_01620 [Ktedonobacterales bacterium]